MCFCGHHVYEELKKICYLKRINFKISVYVSDAKVCNYKYIIYNIINLSVFYVHPSDLSELSEAQLVTTCKTVKNSCGILKGHLLMQMHLFLDSKAYFM